jgi:hypothetical protein
LKTIVFVTENPQIRVYKQAKALKKAGGYHLVLVARDIDIPLFCGVFDEIIPYGLPLLNKIPHGLVRKSHSLQKLEEANLERIVKKLAPSLFHTHAEPNTVPKVVMENAEAPVIYDAYDLSGLRFGLKSLDTRERKAERYCLENADGIVLKFQEDILDFYRQEGYGINAPYLCYLDYCDPDYFVEDARMERESHLVYAGAVLPAKSPHETTGNNQFHDLVRILIGQGIYFHIYPNIWQAKSPRYYACYGQISHESKYFKMHAPLPQPALQKEISKYTYGVQIHDLSRTRHTRLFGESSFGNKFFTYLEAGLPIIVSDNLKYNCDLAEGFGVGFRIGLRDLERISDRIGEADYGHLRKNVMAARAGPLNMHENVAKLTGFYDRIIQKA